MEILAVNCQLDVILGPSGGVLRRWRLPLCDVSLSQTYHNGILSKKKEPDGAKCFWFLVFPFHLAYRYAVKFLRLFFQ
jgi:hypothetical protein